MWQRMCCACFNYAINQSQNVSWHTYYVLCDHSTFSLTGKASSGKQGLDTIPNSSTTLKKYMKLPNWQLAWAHRTYILWSDKFEGPGSMLRRQRGLNPASIPCYRCGGRKSRISLFPRESLHFWVILKMSVFSLGTIIAFQDKLCTHSFQWGE